MNEIVSFLTSVLDQIVNFSIVILEFIGVGIIVYTCVRGFGMFLKRSDQTRLYLANGLLMGLEFKLGSEILRTVIVREWKEISIAGGIILLRAALNFLIHWEIRQETSEREEKAS